jgi:hypothetical protein
MMLQPWFAALAILAFDDPPKTGRFTLTFAERSSKSSVAEVTKRLGVAPAAQRGQKPEDYDLEKESFGVYVPKSYTGEKPFGLLVFISPGPDGGVEKFDRDGGWTKALDEREIIWVGPNNAGNDRAVMPRLGLALDAAHNMPKRFKIDPERVYIGGVSGGGRLTSWLLLPFPDVFTGGYSIIGADFYKNLNSREQVGIHPAAFRAPNPKTLGQAKRRRYVLLTGDNDANLEHMQLIHQSLKKDGWRNCFYFQVPGLPHAPPDGEWFAKGLAALDGETPAAATETPGRNPPKKASAKKPRP